MNVNSKRTYIAYTEFLCVDVIRWNHVGNSKKLESISARFCVFWEDRTADIQLRSKQ